MAEDNPLLGLRDKIDALDLQIMQAISDRARCAQQVAEVKKVRATWPTTSLSVRPRYCVILWKKMPAL